MKISIDKHTDGKKDNDTDKDNNSCTSHTLQQGKKQRTNLRKQRITNERRIRHEREAEREPQKPKNDIEREK